MGYHRKRALRFGIPAVMMLLCSPGLAAPPAGKLLESHRSFAASARTVEADLRVQTGPAAPHHPLDGLRRGLTRGVQLHGGKRVDSEVALRPDLPPGEPATLSLKKDRSLRLSGALRADLTLRKLPKDAPPELRVLALALGSTKLATSLGRIGVRFHREVLTLDRIDGRLVWAVGDGEACLWLDRELHRLVRIELGPGVIDEDVWAATLKYDHRGPGKGWFPSSVLVEKNRTHVLTVNTASAVLRKR